LIDAVLFIFIGCPLPNGRLLKVGEQYTNDQCTRLCTCNEEGLVACMELCPTRPISECNAPLVQKKIRVHTGPPDSKCTCEQVICVKAGMYSKYALENNSTISDVV
jgi:hypothetical protein